MLSSFLSDANNGTFIGTAVLAGLFTLSVAHVVNTKKREHAWPHVPYTIPFVGNFVEVKSPVNISNKLHEWAVSYGKESGCFQILLAGVKYIVVCREDVAMQIFRKRPFKVIRNTTLKSSVDSINAAGLFSAEGDDWKQDRRLVSPALNHASVDKYFPSVKIITGRLINKWEKLRSSNEGSTVTINEDCHHALIDLNSLTILGTDFDSLRDDSNDNVKDLSIIWRALLARALSPVWYWKIPVVGQYLDGAGWANYRLEKLLEGVIKKHEETPDADTFVGRAILLSRKEGSKLDRRRLTGNLMTMFVGGVDTGSSSLMTNLWLLATHPEIQLELAKEALSVDLEESNVDCIRRALPRLLSWHYETQRVFSSATLLMFQAKEDITFMNADLPQGTNFIALLKHIGMNPYSPAPGTPLGPNGESPLVFCPARWLVNRDNGSELTVQAPSNKDGAFMAFGHGVRQCPGRGFAESMQLFVMASLLSKYEISLPDNHPEVKREYNFVEAPATDIQLVLKPRVV